ncbi:hypothetical protein AcV5_007319 [Taiwanofungus camphoratus]|nr:hypothetical protein AcV5_007319 [Antrodia cinnamomea]
MERTTVFLEPLYYCPQYCHPQQHHRGKIPNLHSARTSSPIAIGTIPRPHLARRYHTMNTYDYAHQDKGPWEHMAQTYAWVVEQQIADMALKNEETVRWVLKQQERDVAREQAAFRVFGEGSTLRGFMDGLLHEVHLGSHRYGAAEDIWKESMQWHRDAERVVLEELQRLHATRLETERCRLAYERQRAQEEERERRRREKQREKVRVHRDDANREAWRAYEAQWAEITSATSSGEQLTFRTIPWPMFSPPRTIEDITPARIVMFLLSPLHSEGQARKDRVRCALRRWHPDRFGRILDKVNEHDREAVERGSGIVVRCLNNLLERES